MPQRIRIECPTNDRVRKYHVTANISSEPLRAGFMGATRHDPFKNDSLLGRQDRELGEDTKATILRFYDIDGVEAVGVDFNMVEITRSPAYEWAEIENDIIIGIKEIVNWYDDSEMEVDYMFAGRIQSDDVTREQYEVEQQRQQRLYEVETRLHGHF